jgi:subtilisin family serine protease
VKNSIGKYCSTIITSPPLKKSILVKKSLMGWGTKVAVLDSGVSKDVKYTDCKDFTGTGIIDTFGHGAYVAKIIKFYAPAANLYIAKIGPEKPVEANIMQALKWAQDMGVNIINISSGIYENRPLSGCKDRCTLCQAVNLASDKGIVVVVAAGNDPRKIMPCPACSSKAITVGAVDQDGYLAKYNVKGRGGKPNILAPGSVCIDGTPLEGTSFAAPIISGILAATMNKYPDIEKTRRILYNTATDLGLPVNMQGNGVLNIESFLEVLEHEQIDDTSKGYEEH